MKIPADILEKVDAVLKKRALRKENERRSIELRKEEDERLEDLQQAYRGESLKRLKVILDWVARFMDNPDRKAIFKVTEGVNIFVANFWLGRPQPGKIYATWARIVLNKTGHLRYEEVHKGHASQVVQLGYNRPHPGIFVNKLHPEFLKQWEAEIREGKVWDYVRYSLPQYV